MDGPSDKPPAPAHHLQQAVNSRCVSEAAKSVPDCFQAGCPQRD